MPYLLAAFAIIVPVVLVVQTIRGRVRVQCCAVEPTRDLRMRGAFDEQSPTPRLLHHNDAVSILAIDQGTSATKAVIWPRQGIAAEIDAPFEGPTHQGDAIEQDPEALWGEHRDGGSPGHRLVRHAAIRAVAIGNQGETVLAWDRATGRPLAPAIVLAGPASATGRRGSRRPTPALLRITGLPLDPYFAAPKMAWLRARLDLPAGGDASSPRSTRGSPTA